MRLGSLCTGYGGLDLAAEAHYGAETVWVCEYNPQASTVLEHRFPVPNLTDLTAVDWTTVTPVDVLTAGYPCQPFSHAGRRKGTEDDRHIWPHIADAVRVLRPGVVVLENVAGHLSLGFGDVLGDLAALGYDARWCCVRASDAGAPHRRERVFIVATDARGLEPLRRHAARGLRGVAREVEGGARERERPRPPAGDRGEDAADADGVGWGPGPGLREGEAGRVGSGRFGDVGREVDERPAAWGDYWPAIAHWELVIGRPAPAPTDDRGRLAPRFVEWMMGLPDGWVTDLIPQRTHALRILGNGVVPQQAALALTMLASATPAERSATVN